MARLSQVVKLDKDREVTVKEVTPYDIYRAYSAKDKLGGLKVIAQNCIDLEFDDLIKLYPSEILKVADGFLEVNSSFLAIADRFGFKETLITTAKQTLSRIPEIVDELLTNLPLVFASSFKEVMAKMPGITDGTASAQPSKPLPAREQEASK